MQQEKMKITKVIAAIFILAASFLLFKNQFYNIFFTQKDDMINSVQKTFAIIKPDAVAAKNSGKIIDIIEQNGFDILDIKKLKLTKDQAENFYAEHKGKPFFNGLVKFMTSGSVIIMVLSKDDAILQWRNLMGATNPEKAENNTIRKQFGKNIDNNAVHGSDSPESAKREIGQFFPELAK